MDTTTPSPLTVLTADFPDWAIWRDLLDGPGHWQACRGDRAVSAPTIGQLRERLARIELAEAAR